MAHLSPTYQRTLGRYQVGPDHLLSRLQPEHAGSSLEHFNLRCRQLSQEGNRLPVCNKPSVPLMALRCCTQLIDCMRSLSAGNVRAECFCLTTFGPSECWSEAVQPLYYFRCTFVCSTVLLTNPCRYDAHWVRR